MASIASKSVALVKSGVELAIPKLNKFATYAKVELVPPTPAEIGVAIGSFGKVMKSATTGKFLNLPVKEAWVNTLVGVEIACWFFIGECIGKRSLIAYQV